MMSAIIERISAPDMLKLLCAMLGRGSPRAGRVTRSTSGAPQRGVISPVVCNAYLHRLDRQCQIVAPGS